MSHPSTGRANREASFQELHRRLADLVHESRELNANERERRAFENEERRLRETRHLRVAA